MKKFYKLVTADEVNDGYRIALDGKQVKTPSGKALFIPTRELADEIVKEWAAQKETVLPDTMPLTQILTTAQDHVAVGRADMTDRLLAYLNTDLICYRTDHPEDLARKQRECWDQWVDWFEDHYGMRLEITTGLAALRQIDKAHEKVAADIRAMDEEEFTVLQLAVPLTGSLVLGLAFVKGDAGPEQLYEAANIEENYKAEIYEETKHGAAPQQEKNQLAMQRDLEAARKFLGLCKI